MKVLVNWRYAICNDCGQRECATIRGGEIVCYFCESKNLKDKHWNEFTPIWKTDARNPARKLWSHHMRRKGDVIYGQIK